VPGCKSFRFLAGDLVYNAVSSGNSRIFPAFSVIFCLTISGGLRRTTKNPEEVAYLEILRRVSARYWAVMPNGASFAGTVKRAVPGRNAGFTDSVAKTGTL
jgi:hypothetical protein